MYEMERDRETALEHPRSILLSDLDTMPLARCRDTANIDLFGDETGCNHPFFACFGVSLLIVLISTIAAIMLFR